ncbi:MAG: hypothetical protein IBX46_11350 [Desulfuromonadales bacterium]|nr:hypothetical protein [Desulfuromonadales bacterium]
MGLKRLLSLLILTTFLSACSMTPTHRIERTVDLQRPTEETILYFVPFLPVLAPDELTSDLFNQIVDGFDGAAAGSGLSALILKREVASVDPAWLGQQYYVTGSVFAYGQDSGCCSTEIKLSTRLQLYQPGTPYPVLRIDLPYRILFDHDRSNLEIETERMAATLAEQLRNALLAEIAPL